MIKVATYKCGHEGEVPAHMGRGQARQKRIAQHFNRSCQACRKEALESQARKLRVLLPGVDSLGFRNMRPYSEEEVQAYVARHLKA